MDESKSNPKKVLKAAEGFEILVSEKDQAKIDRRRQAEQQVE